MLFHVLGPLEVHNPAARQLGAGKPATLLATLLVQPNTWVAGDELVDAVWPDQAAPASAEANLKTYVWQLRRLLPGYGGDARIEGRPGAYRVRVGAGELDAELAGELGRAARVAVAEGDPDRAVRLLEEALRLWRGRPFADLAGPSVAGAVAHLDELRLELRELLAEAQLTLGRGTPAVAALRAVTAESPLREGAWALLVRALHASGLRAEALAAYQRAREVLARELGIEPGPALAEAYRATLGGARGGAARRELPRDVPLAGRAAELAAVRRAATGAAPVVLVDGMAGVGKTALAVHAAHRLAPRYPDGQFFVDLRGNADGDPADPGHVLGRLLRGIGVPEAETPADPGERAALWRSELARRRVLLLLDDASSGDQVLPLLPAGTACLTLVTTRGRGWHCDGATRIRLEPLAGANGTALLRAAIGDRADAVGRPAVAPAATDALTDTLADVVRRCGGLPAALRDAAARLHTRPEWTVRRLADELRDDPCRVLSEAVRRSVVDSCRRLDGLVLATWHALDGLPGEFGPSAVARTLGVGRDAARACLEALVDRGLLEPAGPDSYRGHVLLRHLAGCSAGPGRRHERRRVA
ncbi:BTAD domain-containing putative transcriptional regulator [Micromonospora sp. NPDC049559]|uniref:AfsR/SARP family transcriptional regulator n=1 Tax=Micromonospora sp. NPDC049559 TaxID=3155923 RepID=UPI00342D9BCB